MSAIFKTFADLRAAGYLPVSGLGRDGTVLRGRRHGDCILLVDTDRGMSQGCQYAIRAFRGDKRRDFARSEIVNLSDELNRGGQVGGFTVVFAPGKVEGALREALAWLGGDDAAGSREGEGSGSVKRLTLTCCGCDASRTFVGRDLDEILIEVDRCGWQDNPEDRDYCPACLARKSEPSGNPA